MIEDLRHRFNAGWTERAYEDYKARLAAAVGAPIRFRVCETPVFLPPELRDAMVQGAIEIWRQLLRPEALERSKAAVPAAFDVPDDSSPHPLFAQADFAVVRDGERLAPRLIELQAFPSLYAFQFLQTRMLRDDLRATARLEFLLGGLDEDGYVRVLRQAVLGGHPAPNVVLLDLDPEQQNTWPDFSATEQLLGIRSVCPTDVRKRGRELWYERDGRATRIARVYNRLIVDELVEKGVELPFRYTEPLDVEWAGHPNWFFRWSKHALPGLAHPLVPEAHLLSELERVPEDLAGWVLKPLFSFSGSGVKVDVTEGDLAAVPPEARASTLLMRKVDYAPVVVAPDGARSRVEVRVMFVWHDGQPLPMTTLARLSQGRMMGVKYNKDKTWVGSTGCLWPVAPGPA